MLWLVGGVREIVLIMGADGKVRYRKFAVLVFENIIDFCVRMVYPIYRKFWF